MRTPDLSASAITSVSNRLFPMPGGPSMTSTPPWPCASAVSSAPITFNSPARPRIGGVTSWPPTSKRRVEGPTGCPVYRLLHCHCSARHCRHPPIHAEHISMLLSVRDLVQRLGTDSPTSAATITTGGDRAGKQNRQFIGALTERFRHFSGPVLHFVALHGRKTRPTPRPCHCPRDWSIGPGHELRQLGAGVDAQLGERIVDVGFHRVQGKVQLCGD